MIQGDLRQGKAAPALSAVSAPGVKATYAGNSGLPKTLSREYSRARARDASSAAQFGNGIPHSRTPVPYHSIH